MSSANNISGQAYSLTVITPIIDGHETELAHYLNGLQSGDQSPLAGVHGTHFARWVVIDDVVYEGPDQGQREHLAHPRLLFTRNRADNRIVGPVGIEEPQECGTGNK